MGVAGWRTPVPDQSPTDRWALSPLNPLVRDVTEGMDAYDIHQPTKAIEGLSKSCRTGMSAATAGVWKTEGDADKEAAYQTLYTCLQTLAKLAAPFMPFLSEAIYQNLVRRNGGMGTGEEGKEE